MSKGCSGVSASIATHRNAASSAADVLALAAAPTFAIMALLTGIVRSSRVEMGGMTAHVTPISGMVMMYLLMSVFHAGAWLKLISSRLYTPASSVSTQDLVAKHYAVRRDHEASNRFASLRNDAGVTASDSVDAGCHSGRFAHNPNKDRLISSHVARSLHACR